MPHVPLKVLRGEQDQEDVQDQHYERFQAPGTTTEDVEDDKETDDDSITSNDDMTTIGEVGEEGRERYLDGDTDSVDTVIRFDNEIQNHQDKNSQENPDYSTGKSLNLGTVDVEAVAQVHHLQDSDEPGNDSSSNDDTAPLLTNMN